MFRNPPGHLPLEPIGLSKFCEKYHGKQSKDILTNVCFHIFGESLLFHNVSLDSEELHFPLR